jgi:hypothetical protein
MLPALTGAPDPAVAVLLFVLLVLIRVGGEGVPLVVVGACLRSALMEVREKDLSFGPFRFLEALLNDLGFWLRVLFHSDG